jgi:ATP-dependent DNA helicase RecG
MTELELQALISQGEGLHIEFKESINTGLSKEIVAFANAKGGTILIGVDDDGNIKKKLLNNGDRSKIQVSARDCDPSIDIDIEIVENVPSVLVVRIKEGANKPYRCTSGFYLREGANSNKRKTNEIFDMFREAERFSFDDALCKKADFEKDFNPQLLKRFFAKAGKEQILSNEDTLHNLGLLEFVEGKPILNNTGVLFFTNEPSKFIPQAIIQCVRYKGIIKLDIEDQKDMTFDMLKNIDECFAFLRRSLNVAFKFESGNPKRQEVWEIPYIALREALVNAMSHRDYINRGTHIQVEIFDDRVSITNSGGLAKGITNKDLRRRSTRRNPNIVNIFHRADYIEKLGTGLLRIDDELKKAGLPKVEFDVDENWFEIIFSRKIKETYSNFDGSYSLSSRQIDIIKFCVSEPKSRADIFDFLEMLNQTRSFNRHVLPLIENDFLNLTLPDKPTSRNQMYFTTEKGKSYL